MALAAGGKHEDSRKEYHKRSPPPKRCVTIDPETPSGRAERDDEPVPADTPAGDRNDEPVPADTPAGDSVDVWEGVMNREWGDDGLTALGIGDMISLNLSEVGLLVGNVCLNRLGVEHASGPRGRVPGAGGAPEDGVFRICPKLNYRARREMKRLELSVRGQRKDDKSAKLALSRLKKRLQQERGQNEEWMQQVRSRGKIAPIYYGDIMQLEHVRSQKFVGMLKSPALLNTNNHTVALMGSGEDGESCYFRIVPRFKVRSLGSKVFADDVVVFESVKFDGFVLSASTEHAFVRAKQTETTLVPRVLRNPRTLEVSGLLLRRGVDGKPVTVTAMSASLLDTSTASGGSGGGDDDETKSELNLGSVVSDPEGTGRAHKHQSVASFQLKLFARFRDGDATERLTSFSKVRLFLPEFNGYVCASANRDKGEVLDALPEEVSQGAATRTRWGAGRPHCTYLKPLHGSDPSAPVNLSAKAVWRFEPVEELAAGVVSYNEPVRLRHVPSNLFLAIDLSKPAVKVKVAKLEAASLTGASPSSRKSSMSKMFSNFDSVVSAATHAAKEAAADPPFYDCFLTDGKGGAWGSGSPVPPEAMVFRIIPTDEDSAELKQGLSTIRLEHRTSDGQRLYLSHIDDFKPDFMEQTLSPHLQQQNAAREALLGGSGGSSSTNTASWDPSPVGLNEHKTRVGFVARVTGLEAVVVRPVAPAEDEALDAVLDHLEVVSLYGHRYRTAATLEKLPVDSCEELVGVLLNLLDLLQKGKPSPRRHKTVADYMNEANTMQAPQFSAVNFGGEVNPKVQELCFQTKLLDALFAAALAPYNRLFFERGQGTPGPFDSPVTADQPAATQKFIYLCIQRICFDNEMVMEYFARAQARVWRSSGVRETELWSNLLVDQGEDGFGATVLLAQLFRSSSAILKKLVNDEILERFKLLIKKCGPQGRLINLFASTCFVEGRPMRAFQEACVRKLWMHPVDRYNMGLTFHETTEEKVKTAFSRCDGLRFPYAPPRTHNYEGSASIKTRFGIGLGGGAKKHKFYGHVRYKPNVTPPQSYLGKGESNSYPPVGVVWRSSPTLDWGSTTEQQDLRGLFWSPRGLDIPSLEPYCYPKGNSPESEKYVGELVPLELLMWVLEPERLGEAVTGKEFVPFVTAADSRKHFLQLQHQQQAYEAAAKADRDAHKTQKRSKGMLQLLGSPTPAKKPASQGVTSHSPKTPVPPTPGSPPDSKRARRRMSHGFRQRESGAEMFRRKKQLALYVIDQVNLLTQMCRGRCDNAIRSLESCFSYTLLMNMASNPWLPYRFRAVVVHFVLALYVDRYPQIPACGAAQLPEAIWIYNDDEFSQEVGAPKKSTLPVVNPKLTLRHEDAFPGFCVPVLSMAYGHSNPVVSLPDHNKFFLLRTLCNDVLQKDGLVYDDLGDGGFNALTAALLTGQADLLEFGFQSTIEKIRDMCKTNAYMLDGRRDQIRPGQYFNPPERRFHDMGQHTEAIIGIKRAIIDEFFDLTDLRVNYRLALLLGEFKTKMQSVRSWKAGQAGVDAVGRWSRSFEVFALFEGLFQLALPRYDENMGGDNPGFLANFMHSTVVGGVGRTSKHDAHLLEFSKLADKDDFDDVLLDNMLYDSDELMAASLHLLDLNYGMRRSLVNSLGDVVLLEDPRIAVYGEVYILRSDITELAELISTYTVWGVNSVISGDFDQNKYGRLMRVVDMLLEFIYSPELTDADKEGRKNSGAANKKQKKKKLADSSARQPSLDRDGGSGGHSESKDSDPYRAPGAPLFGRPMASADLDHSLEESAAAPAVVGDSSFAMAQSTAVFISALQKHYREHPEYGTSDEVRSIEFFSKIEKLIVADGLVDHDEFKICVRELLGLSPKEISDEEVTELFDNMSDDRGSINFHAFENFVAGNGDKENYRGLFVDCDKSADGSYYHACKIWSADVASMWLDKTRPSTAKTDTSSNASAEIAAAYASLGCEQAWQQSPSLGTGSRGNSSTSARKPCVFHQSILRGCNLQEVLTEAIHMDPDIAFKGSKCTLGLKIESQRRLTLVNRALLVLYKAFIANNLENQEILFKDLASLQRKATPVELMNADDLADSSFDERVAGLANGQRIEERHYTCFRVLGDDEDSALCLREQLSALREPDAAPTATTAAVAEAKESAPPPPPSLTFGMSHGSGYPMAPSSRWPSTVQEMAQSVILALFRGNEKLCLNLSEDEQQRDALFDLFAFVANKHGEEAKNQPPRAHSGGAPAAAAEGLDEDEPLTTCDSSPALDFFFIMCAPTASRPLKDFQKRVAERLCTFPNLGALARSCASCVRRARVKAEAQSGLATKPLTLQETAENPYRMVRLIKACCQGGNDEVAMLFSSASTMIGVEECCRALLSHCHQAGMPAAVLEDSPVPVGVDLDSERVLLMLSPPPGMASRDVIARVLSGEGDENEVVDGGSCLFGCTSSRKRSTKRQKGQASSSTFEAPEKATPKSSNKKSWFLCSSGRRGKSGKGGASAVASRDVLGCAALTASESYEQGCLREGGAFEVLALLVELVDLLPLSASQVRSPLLWQCVGTVCVPAINALARNRDARVPEHGHHSSGDRIVCAELVDLLERLLTKIHSHDLVDDVLSEQYRAGHPFVDELRDDLLHMAVKHSQTLGKVFSVRSRESVRRIFLLCDGSSLPVPKFSRNDPHHHEAASEGGSMTSRAPHKQLKSRPFIFGSGEQVDLGAAFEAFREGIHDNSFVNTAIRRRRYALLKLLETGTHPDPSKFPTGCAVAVTWDMLVPRFVRYARDPGRFEADIDPTDHNGCETVHIILRLLRDHLVKARTLPLDGNDNVVTAGGKGESSGQRVYDDPRVVTLDTVDVGDLPTPEDRRDFGRKQHALMRHGCVELVARIMMARETLVEEGDLADVALEVLDELQHGGDLKVRKCLYELLSKEDTEGRFLAHLVARMDSTNAKLQEGRNFALLGALGENLTGDMRSAIKHVKQTVQFLTHLCIAHHTEFQNILRVQPMYNVRTYDLVGMCIDLVCVMADSQYTVTFLSLEELDLLRSLLEFLYQCQEGPNPDNQHKIASSDVPMTINLILAADSPIERRLNRRPHPGKARVTLKALCYRVLSASLEGRKDSACHELLRERLEMGLFYEKARALDSKCRVTIARTKSSFLFSSDVADTSQLEADLDALAHLWTIHRELFPEMSERVTRRRLVGRTSDLVLMLTQKMQDGGDSGEHDDEAATIAAIAPTSPDSSGAVMNPLREGDRHERSNSSRPNKPPEQKQRPAVASNSGPRMKRGLRPLVHDDDQYADSDSDGDEKDDLDEDDEEAFLGDDAEFHARRQLVETVEINWGGKTHRVCFPMLLKARFLTEESKRLFLDRARLFSTDKRQELLLGSMDLFVAEMDWVYTLSQRSTLYRLLGRNLEALKLVMYSLVILLNVNVLMSPPSLSKPFDVIFEPKFSNLKGNERVSLILTFVLGGINFIGYFVIMGHVAATIVPIMIYETDKNSERESLLKKPEDWTDLGAFKWWFVTLVFNVMFVFMHATNFPEYYAQSFGLYMFLIFGINLPWTLSCVRNYIVVPSNQVQRSFIIVYDTVVTKPFLRNHLILQFLSVQGFLSSEYFTLMMFDILNISDKLANVTKAVMTHGDSLVLVFYLFVATTLSYASFGIEHFPDDFKTTYEGVTKTFKTTLSAFWFLFYNFSSKGVLREYVQDADPKSSNWLPRIAFDTAYFVWVGIILFTTITALLVDSLGKARTDSASKYAEEKNVCFMCGMKRTAYDDYGLKAGSPSFDDHCNKEHDPWAYMAYVAHLQRRRRLDRTGVESFVQRAICTDGAWIPARSSFVLEAQGKIGPGAQVSDTAKGAEEQRALGTESTTEKRLSLVEEALNQLIALHKSKPPARRSSLSPL